MISERPVTTFLATKLRPKLHSVTCPKAFCCCRNNDCGMFTLGNLFVQLQMCRIRLRHKSCTTQMPSAPYPETDISCIFLLLKLRLRFTNENFLCNFRCVTNSSTYIPNLDFSRYFSRKFWRQGMLQRAMFLHTSTQLCVTSAK